MKPHACTDCGRITTDLYWITPTGRKMIAPRCGKCHEDAMRREQRDNDDQPVISSQRRGK